MGILSTSAMSPPRTPGRSLPPPQWSARWSQLARAVELQPVEPVVLALSGGADSAYLLHLLACAEPRPPILAVHVDHGLRGAESAADAAFCQRLCRTLGVPIEVHRLALPEGPNLEARARQARYRALAESALGAGYPTVLTGHHADDALETLLLRWLRGSELGGLPGLRASRSLASRARPALRVVRPLISMRREEVRCLLRDHGLEWREDASNQDVRFTRNRVRHRLIPRLVQLAGPEAIENLRSFGRAVEGLEEAFARATAHLAWSPHPLVQAARGGPEARLGGSLVRAALMRLSSPLRRRALWRLLLEGTGRPPGRALLDLLLRDLQSGRCTRHSLPGRWSLQLRSGELLLLPPLPLAGCPGFDPNATSSRGAQLELPFPEPASSRREAGSSSPPRRLPGTGWRGRIPIHDHGFPLGLPGRCVLPDGRALSAEITYRPAGAPVPRGSLEVELEAEGLPPSLWVRWCRRGDRFHGLGAPGSKPLRRFLADAGVPREDRGRIPLVFAGQELVWVAGVRPCEARRVTRRTRRRLRLRLEEVSRAETRIGPPTRSALPAARHSRRPESP